jgi:hypothetical protein
MCEVVVVVVVAVAVAVVAIFAAVLVEGNNVELSVTLYDETLTLLN